MNETELSEMLEDMSVVAWEVAGPPADARTIPEYHETPTYWICPGDEDRVGIMVTFGDQAWTLVSDIPMWLANYLATFNPHAMLELTNHFLKEGRVLSPDEQVLHYVGDRRWSGWCGGATGRGTTLLADVTCGRCLAAAGFEE